VPDHVSHQRISEVASHLVLLANTSPTIPYLLLHATKKETHFEFLFDDNFRNDVDMQYTENFHTTNLESTSGIVWQVTPDLSKSVEELYRTYDMYDCGWEAIDFAVFVDESGENWCFKCVFSYPASSSKKRCVVSSEM
jgi:hypothetical protein